MHLYYMLDKPMCSPRMRDDPAIKLKAVDKEGCSPRMRG